MMNRRKALSSMGLALGYAVATPTLLGLMHSCTSEASIGWQPSFFSVPEGEIVLKLVDIILPKTATPAASEVQAHIFIDKFINETMNAQEQAFIKRAMQSFNSKALEAAGKKDLEEVTAVALEDTLALCLKVSKEEQTAYFETITKYKEVITQNKKASLDEGTAMFAFAHNLRGLTILAYKTSEYIGEEVLSYLPVPGEYIACGDVQELTGGKAWSLS